MNACNAEGRRKRRGTITDECAKQGRGGGETRERRPQEQRRTRRCRNVQAANAVQPYICVISFEYLTRLLREPDEVATVVSISTSASERRDSAASCLVEGLLADFGSPSSLRTRAETLTFGGLEGGEVAFRARGLEAADEGTAVALRFG